MHPNADKICESLSRIGGDFGRLGRASAKHGRDVNRRILKDRVCCRDRAEVAARTGVGNPRCGCDLAVLVNHLRREVRLSRRRERRPGRVEERRRPVRKRDTGAGRAISLEVAEAIRDGLTHSVRIDTGQ